MHVQRWAASSNRVVSLQIMAVRVTVISYLRLLALLDESILSLLLLALLFPAEVFGFADLV